MNVGIMHKILKDNKAFCILPFVHLHVDEGSNVKLCCLANSGVTKHDSTFDFKNNAELNGKRIKILNGERVSDCTQCYHFEDGNSTSARIIESEHWLKLLNISDISDLSTGVVSYDIRNDNLCNLSCRMCGPSASTQLEKEYKKLGWEITPIPKSVGFSDVVNLEEVKMIYVAGGEPTIMPSFKKFINKAINSGKTDFELRISTNGTNLNKDYVELLKNFKNLSITFSIDGYNLINRYIRWPSDWDTIIKNIHNTYDITDRVSFNVTASIWNITSLSKLIFKIEEEFPKCDVVLLNKSTQFESQFTLFPNKELAIADLEKLRLSKFYKSDSTFKSKVEYYISEIEKTEIDLLALQKFFEYNDALDASRDIRLIDYIPELEECRKLIKKPTSNTNAE